MELSGRVGSVEQPVSGKGCMIHDGSHFLFSRRKVEDLK
jgi:hypothetical protein